MLVSTQRITDRTKREHFTLREDFFNHVMELFPVLGGNNTKQLWRSADDTGKARDGQKHLRK